MMVTKLSMTYSRKQSVALLDTTQKMSGKWMKLKASLQSTSLTKTLLNSSLVFDRLPCFFTVLFGPSTGCFTTCSAVVSVQNVVPKNLKNATQYCREEVGEGATTQVTVVAAIVIVAVPIVKDAAEAVAGAKHW